jgi:hypothetical protein
VHNPYADPGTRRDAPDVAAAVVDVRTIYEVLMDVAQRHGADEIKHLTRAYQAVAPYGGGRLEDLQRLLG